LRGDRGRGPPIASGVERGSTPRSCEGDSLGDAEERRGRHHSDEEADHMVLLVLAARPDAAVGLWT
jgi:hypothetical protein